MTASSRMMLALLVLTVQVAFVAPTARAAGPWEFGEYRQFSPQSTPQRSVTTTRAITPLRLSRTAVQRPQVAPGEAADLIAEYEVELPQATVEVKEVRIISFEGQQLTRIEKLVSLPRGKAGTSMVLKVPADAAPGLYTVTTTIEPRAAAATRSVGAGDNDTSVFRVATRAAGAPPALSPGESAPAQFKLWTSKSQYKVGEALTVLFQANRDGYVTLVNVGTSGRVTILYPNMYAPNHAVKGGQTYTVPRADEPYQLVLSGPEGTELVYALFTTVPTRFVDDNFTNNAFAPINDKAEAFTRDINLSVKRIPLKEQASASLEIAVTQ
jgi:hypothetical protein